jgi:hypothetical protein
MDATFRLTYLPPDARLDIEGELGVCSRGPLAWRLLELEHLDCGTVHVDLGRATEADRWCLRLLDETRARLVSRGRVLVIDAASPTVLLAATSTGLTDLADCARQPETH